MQCDSKTINFVLPDLGGGGAEKVCVVYADFFKARGYHVRFLVIDGRGIYRKYVQGEFELVDFGKSRFRNAIYALVRYVTFLDCKTNVYVANLWPITALSFWILYSLRKSSALVCLEHCELSLQYNFSRIEKFFVKLEFFMRSFLKCKLVTVSKGVAADISLLGWYKKNYIAVIYNPICFRSRTDVNEGIKYCSDFFDEASLNVIAVGTLKKQKNFDFFIQVIHQVKQFRNVRAVILGNGPERASLESAIKQLGMEKEVLLPGWTSQIEEFLSAADIFVLTSRYEGFANVVAESLLCGTPVISTECRSGPAEILEDGRYGKLLEVDDLDAFKKALLDFSAEDFDPRFLRGRGEFFEVERSGPELERFLMGFGKNRL